MKMMGVGTIGLLTVLFIGFIFFAGGKEKEVVPGLNLKGQPVLGDPEAPVQIVEFGDYKCPACKSFDQAFFPAIKKDLIDTGKAQFFFINYSFLNVDSIRSAQFAEAVYRVLGNDVFWKFHELLYSKQNPTQEKEDVFTATFLENTLQELVSAHEAEKVSRSFASDTFEWKKDMSIAEKIHVTSTPSLFVNGKQFEGNSLEDLIKMVDAAAKEKN